MLACTSGTARQSTLSFWPRANWRLIDGFEKRTGVPVILNTSFNLRGEAIVHTPTGDSDVVQLGDGRAGHRKLPRRKRSARE